MAPVRILYVYYFLAISSIFNGLSECGLRKYTDKDLLKFREEVRQMFHHAYDGYLKYAYPYDELRPLSCDGVDTWGSYSLTLIDALDTLAVMGNYSEFQRVAKMIIQNASFEANINVSVFETNIRIIGGLLSAHLLSHRAGMELEPGWPCNGPLLRLAEDVAQRLIAAFDTATGMPYGTVNLRYGVPEGETTVTCTAGVGTFIVEFGTLSRLTGDPLYEEVALKALNALFHHRSQIGLVGNHIDVMSGRWTAQDAGIGAGVDSYYEYLVKGAILLQRPELMHMFEEGRRAIEKYLKRDDWHLWVSMQKGQVTLPVFQSLEAYWPGLLSLIGNINDAMKTLHNYHQVWRQYGFTPEFYNIPQGEAGVNREGYPLRPELIESAMYLYRATKDPHLLDVGVDILRSIQHSAKTSCGYATIKDVNDHKREDRMESFFLAETTKYLYLLFDEDNFLHNTGQRGTVIQTAYGECVIDAGGFVFNTEAHPIDPGALHCCSGQRDAEIREQIPKKILSLLDPSAFKPFQGEKLSRKIELKKQTRTKAFKKSISDVEDASRTSIQKSEQSAITKREVESLESIHAAEITTSKSEEKSVGFDDVTRDLVRKLVEKLSNNKNHPQKQPGAESSVSTTFRLNDNSEIIKNHAIGEKVKENVSIKHGVGEEGHDDNEIYFTTPETGTSHSTETINDDMDKNTDINVINSATFGNIDEADMTVEDEVDDLNGGEGEVTVTTASDSSPKFVARQQITKLSEAQQDIFGLKNDQSSVTVISEDQTIIRPFNVKKEFNPQVLLERLRSDTRFVLNSTWETDYEFLMCPSQPFINRLALLGEFLDPS